MREKKKFILIFWPCIGDLHMMNTCWICKALALNGEWENAIILSIYFDTMSWRDYSMCSYERQIGFTNKFSLVLFPKNVQKKNVCMTMSYILLCVRNWTHFYKSRIHIWKRAFLLKVDLLYHYKDSGLEICYVVLEKYMGGWIFNINHCEKILQIVVNSFITFICSIFKWKAI